MGGGGFELRHLSDIETSARFPRRNWGPLATHSQKNARRRVFVGCSGLLSLFSI
jgi:hypothetical protein